MISQAFFDHSKMVKRGNCRSTTQSEELRVSSVWTLMRRAHGSCEAHKGCRGSRSDQSLQSGLLWRWTSGTREASKCKKNNDHVILEDALRTRQARGQALVYGPQTTLLHISLACRCGATPDTLGGPIVVLGCARMSVCLFCGFFLIPGLLRAGVSPVLSHHNPATTLLLPPPRLLLWLPQQQTILFDN